MKIALVLDRFDPRRGGLERWTHRFAEWLVSGGHVVHVVASEFGDTSLEVKRHPFPWSDSPLLRGKAAAHIVERLGTDAIYDTGTSWHFTALHPHGGSRLADHRQNLRSMTWSERLRAQFTTRRRLAEKLTLERRQFDSPAGKIIAVSHMVARDLRASGVDPARIVVIPNGVDPAHFTPAHRDRWREPMRAQLGVGESETLFLFAAHNFRLKGLRPALRALARVPRARLVVVGRGEPVAAERVTFTGATDDLRPFYAAADILLHPTFYDPCSLVALEAWASGLPVLTTRFNGAAELMDSSNPAGHILDDPANIPALAAAMTHLLDPALRASMSAAARALAMRHTAEENFAAILRAMTRKN